MTAGLEEQGNERRRGAQSRPRTHAFGAIDLGTNNCRLLVARPEGPAFRVIDAFSRIVRLGEGVSARGELSDQAMDRTIAALRVCAGKLRHHQVNRVRSVATDACRRASNRDGFVARVARETGIDLEIISSREEAELAIAGCLALIDGDARWALMFDIGGGSTELVWMRCDGAARELIAWTSLPCGVVTLAEAHGGDRISRQLYGAMVDKVADMLAPFEDENHIAQHATGGEIQMLGTSGTVTTIAGVHLNLLRYDRSRVDGLHLSFDAIDAVSARLVALDQRGRAAIPTIGPERADLVVAGCAILDAIRRLWPVGSLWVADRGIRWGILMDMIHPCRPAPTFTN